MPKNMPSSLVPLSAQDLILHERELQATLARFITFKSSSLYFPKDTGEQAVADETTFDPSSGKAVYLKDEHRLLLPLVHRDKPLGVFLARGIRLAAPTTMTVVLPGVASLFLENIALAKTAQCDPLTGLLNKHAFMDLLRRTIEQAQNCVLPAADACIDPGLGISGRLSMLVCNLDHFKTVAQTHGFRAGDDVFDEMARRLRKACPKNASLCRLDKDEFAVLMPDTTPAKCLKLADKIRCAVHAESFTLKDGEHVRLTASLGCASYPNDLRGAQIASHPGEMAKILLFKALKAMSVAKEHGRDRAFSFGRILEQGGAILEMLPMNRLSLNLGRDVDAAEGLRFLVWSPKFLDEAEAKSGDGQRLLGRYPAMYKGEIVITEAQEDMAFAEIMDVSDPAWPLEPGDRLSLLDEPGKRNGPPNPAKPPQKDILTGLYGYTGFLSCLAREQSQLESYALVMIRLEGTNGAPTTGNRKEIENRVKDAASLMHEIFGAEITAGRYGLAALACIVQQGTPEAMARAAQKYCEQAVQRLGVTPALGVGYFPCLDYAKSDVLENSRKALDHALLLDTPKAAVFDSISLNISADRLFSHGDVYAAIEEYKRSLLLDEDNTLSRNSLAVCYARLSKLDQAAATFRQVMERDPKNLMAVYNFGYSCLRMGDDAAAAKAFRRCLKIDPDHLFSLIRLGQIQEAKKQYKQAATTLRKAVKLPGGEGAAARHLARLALATDQPDKARDLLHKAVTHNPGDAQSIYLLAKLYLDSGEDPEIAVALGRKCVEIKPSSPVYWKFLADGLAAMGDKDEAARARTRAANLT
ncbi:MAG: diguanylate cyclase domain-containing protein [Desulfovibrio sp.]|uniref:diguanylate cyclase domain-containing protein n=1 Tax=Desulfovibrio sp. 7SRBS1 TaxID=3378064 RepID=UPI003B3EFA0F